MGLLQHGVPTLGGFVQLKILKIKQESDHSLGQGTMSGCWVLVVILTVAHISISIVCFAYKGHCKGGGVSLPDFVLGGRGFSWHYTLSFESPCQV